jgi:hypothetical protein
VPGGLGLSRQGAEPPNRGGEFVLKS